MSPYKIVNSGFQVATASEAGSLSIDSQIQQIFALKQTIAASYRRIAEIDDNSVYKEGLIAETPSEAWKTLNDERSTVVKQLFGHRQKGIVGLNDQYKDASQSLANQMANSDKNPFKILGKLYEKDSEVALELNANLTKFQLFYRKTLGEEIRRLFNVPAELPLHVELKEGGQSDGFKVKFNGKTIFVKESMSYQQNLGMTHTRINPKELFVYKILEKCHLGPKTKFIVQPYSSGRSGAKLCFICTQDVSHTKRPNQNSKEFILDNLDRSFMRDSENLDIWRIALQDRSFCSELLGLSMLDDVLLLRDTFAANAANYGVIKIENRETGDVRYKPKLIDHLPYSRVAESNGQKFEYRSLDDAIDRLRYKVLANKRCKDSRKSPNITVLGELIHQEQNTLLSSVQQAKQRLIDGKQGKERSGIRKAIEDAYTEITEMLAVEETKDAYVEDAKALIEEYVKKINQHITLLEQF